MPDFGSTDWWLAWVILSVAFFTIYVIWRVLTDPPRKRDDDDWDAWN